MNVNFRPEGHYSPADGFFVEQDFLYVVGHGE